MNTIKKSIVLLFLGVIVLNSFSCDSKKKQERDADRRLEKIEVLITENNFNVAKTEIDSIHILYPRLVHKRRTAQALQDTIIRYESIKTLAYCDSVYPIRKHLADSLARANFRFEKEEKYQDLGNYVPKFQRTENNAERTFLKAYVDEAANFYLVSNHCGTKLEHTYVNASIKDVYVETQEIPLSNPSNYNFSDGGSYWENITFKNDEGVNVASFINQYAGERIKITLKGGKNYIYYLDRQDKNAISQTYNFWVVKKDVVQLEKEIKKAKQRIENINNRYKKEQLTQE